jgi:hypothetical protein
VGHTVKKLANYPPIENLGKIRKEFVESQLNLRRNKASKGCIPICSALSWI